jgi:hypothetical protein
MQKKKILKQNMGQKWPLSDLQLGCKNDKSVKYGKEGPNMTFKDVLLICWAASQLIGFTSEPQNKKSKILTLSANITGATNYI